MIFCVEYLFQFRFSTRSLLFVIGSMVPNPPDNDRFDEDSLAKAFDEHKHRLRKMIAFRLDPRFAARVDPDDVLQDAYVQAAARLSEYTSDPRVPLFTWIRFLVNQQIAGVHRWHSRGKRNARLDIVDGQSRSRISGLSSHSVLSRITGRDSTPSLVASRHELQTTLRELVESLDESDREILCLRHFEELTNSESATELAITQAAASKRYIRALERLREIAIDHELDL